MSNKLNHDKLRKLKEKHDNKIVEVEKMETQIVNAVFKDYIDKDERQKLLQEAKTFCYSEAKISKVEEVFNNFNTDTLKYNVAVDILEMQTHIQENKKEGFFSKIANVVIPKDDLSNE